MAEYVERTDAGSVLPTRGAVRMLDGTATGFAMFGGFTFCALIVMSIVSIVGRKLFAMPVQGDVELMQMGAAVGAAAFLPICEMHDNNIKVDALTGWMSAAARAALDTVAHVMLTDVECGYCRKFHNEIAEYTKRGIEVEYLAFPRAGLGSPDYRKMVSVWCADDRKKALTDAKNDRAVPARTCKTPVDMQYNAGLRMGLEGTPMILSTDGQFIGGYLPPDVLLQRMQQVDAERADSGA